MIFSNSSPPRDASACATLFTQAIVLLTAVPVVLARRLPGMAFPAQIPGASGPDGLGAVVHEKALAFQESWTAMATYAMASQQTLAGEMLRSLSAPTGAANVFAARDFVQMALENTLTLLSEGLAPVVSRVASNSRRLTGPHGAA